MIWKYISSKCWLCCLLELTCTDAYWIRYNLKSCIINKWHIETNISPHQPNSSHTSTTLISTYTNTLFSLKTNTSVSKHQHSHVHKHDLYITTQICMLLRFCILFLLYVSLIPSLNIFTSHIRITVNIQIHALTIQL